MLYAKLASNLTSVQDSLLRPIKIVAVVACTFVWIGFSVALVACGVNEWQDTITRIMISCNVLASTSIAVTWSYYRYMIIQLLLSPTMNEVQRHERQRVAKTLRGYVVHTAINLLSNVALMIVMLSWYWLRARLTYWGALTTISFSMMALRSIRTYDPHRVAAAAQTIGVTPKQAPVVIAAPTACCGCSSSQWQW
jgi:hypothetical protein